MDERNEQAPRLTLPVLDERQFRLIADFTYDWETWVGPSGEVLWVNPAVERITGYTVAECMCMPDYPIGLVHEADRPGIREVLERARALDSGNHYEFRVRRKDGAVVWAAISWQPLVSASGTPLGYRSSVRDIDERKRLEQQLHEALREAQSANRAKSEFLANVSHELRTPLHSILGYAQLLGAARLEEPCGAYVRTLIEQGELLDRLVSDLLDYSSLQAGVLPLRADEYRPSAVIEAVVRALEPMAREKGLRLELGSVHTPERCIGDPQRVSQVLNNLVANAIKFTDEGRVDISAELSGEDGYRVVVDDTGPGMADDESLFAPFRQGSTRAGARPLGGVGLGLAISRQLCERMGGSLVSAASPSAGARFIATFPARALGAATASLAPFEPNVEASPVSRSFAERHPLSVLVIDDMDAAREFIQAALRALGYEPVLAESAERGFACAEAGKYGLVLVDLHMPLVDGWATARGLRDRLGPEPLVVALTADALANDQAQLGAAGFDGFAQKPLRLAELQALLRRAHERTVRAPAASEFDAERWRELSEIHASGGETLLSRMIRRLRSSLPEARAQLGRARERGTPGEVGRALHDIHGLLALIGATRAAEVVAQAEAAAAGQGVSRAGWEDVERCLDAVSHELDNGAQGSSSAGSGPLV